jgi:hypothetical protein
MKDQNGRYSLDDCVVGCGLWVVGCGLWVVGRGSMGMGSSVVTRSFGAAHRNTHVVEALLVLHK